MRPCFGMEEFKFGNNNEKLFLEPLACAAYIASSLSLIVWNAESCSWKLDSPCHQHTYRKKEATLRVPIDKVGL